MIELRWVRCAMRDAKILQYREKIFMEDVTKGIYSYWGEWMPVPVEDLTEDEWRVRFP